MGTVKKIGFIVGMMLMAVFLVGCGSDEQAGSAKGSQKEEKSIDEQPRFLYHEELYVTDGYTYGDLHLQVGHSAAERISSDVLEASYASDDSNKKAYYVTIEKELYEHSENDGSVKIAENVEEYEIGNEAAPILYRNLAGDLFIVKEGEKESVAPNVRRFFLYDDALYHVNFANELSVYHLESQSTTPLANEVSRVVHHWDSGDFTYLDEEQVLHYWNQEKEESISLSKDPIIGNEMHHDENFVSFLLYGESPHESELIQVDLKTQEETIVAYGAIEFKYVDGTYYFKAYDSNFYKTRADDDEVQVVAADIESFEVKDSETIFYIKNNKMLFQVDESGDLLFVEAVKSHQFTEEGDFFSLTEDGSLHRNSEEIATDVNEFNSKSGILTYSSNEGQLILRQSGNRIQEFDAELTDYDIALYQNELVYYSGNQPEPETNLDFTDLAGLWETEYNEHFHMTEDGEIIILGYEEEVRQAHVVHSDLDSMQVEVESEGIYEIERIDENTITFKVSDSLVQAFNLATNFLELTRVPETEAKEILSE